MAKLNTLSTMALRSLLLALQLTATLSVGLSQSRLGGSQGVTDLMKQLREGPVLAVTVNRLADAGAVEAIPILKMKFAANSSQPSKHIFPSDDLLDKSTIASALVRLGAKEEQYWRFLVAQAKIAAENDAPFPILLDSKGQMLPKQLSSEFIAWARVQKVSPENAAWNQQYGMPLRMMPLAATGDPRGLSLLRKALTTHNYLVQAKAAQGLALLRDKDSIPLIINACTKAPGDFSMLIARALPFFDDPRARAGAEQFIRDRAVLDELREQNRKGGARSMFR